MANKSNSKGNSFERSVARDLGSWLFNDKKSLYRSRGSGSLFTRGTFRTEISDISPIRTGLYYPLCIECKNREGVDCDPSSLIKQGINSQLYKWFIKNEKDAGSGKLFPMLIFKKNFMGTYVLFRRIGLSMDEFQITAFRFYRPDILYLAKLDLFMSYINGPKFLDYLKGRGYKNYGR